MFPPSLYLSLCFTSRRFADTTRSPNDGSVEARLANLPEERKRKKFLEDFRPGRSRWGWTGGCVGGWNVTGRREAWSSKSA